MSWGGSAQSANDSIKFNRRQLGKRPNMFKKKWGYKHAKTNLIKESGGNNKYQELNDYQRNLIKERIRKEQGRERKLTIVLTVVVLLITILSFIKFLPFFFHNTNNIKKEISSKDQEYLDYLESGDVWLTENKFDASIIQYQNALQLYPNSKDAKYRLAIAYGYKCEQLKFDCDLGKKMVDELLLLENSNITQELQKLDSLFIANTVEPVFIGN